VNVAGSLQARGGNGGAGGAAGTEPQATGAINGFAGGGGGGGRVAVISPNPVQGVTPSNGSNASGLTGGTPTVGIHQVAACTPTVTSIQVNGQATSTIIAGTSGSVTIYGSCLGSATSVQSDGSGLDFTSITYTADGRIDMSYQASSSASLGVHNVTVTTVNGTNAISVAAQVVVAAGPPTITGRYPQSAIQVADGVGIWWLGTASVNDNCVPGSADPSQACYWNWVTLSVSPAAGGSPPTQNSPAVWSLTDASTKQAPTYLSYFCLDLACSAISVTAISQPPSCGAVGVRVTLGGVASASFALNVDWPSAASVIALHDMDWNDPANPDRKFVFAWMLRLQI
jgi:hypothetical protein